LLVTGTTTLGAVGLFESLSLPQDATINKVKIVNNFFIFFSYD